MWIWSISRRGDPGHDGSRPGRGHPAGRHPPLVIAVTQLTSTSQERMQEELLVSAPMDETVMHYAANAAKARPGRGGVLPMEAGKVHDTCGKAFSP